MENRIRTIPGAVREIKEKDPNTIMTVATLRKMVKRGEVPHVAIGGRVFVNMERLEEVLYG